MKHSLETLKYKMERFPETIVPYDYLMQMMDELRQEIRKAQRFRENGSLMSEMAWVPKVKEILGDE